MHSDQEAASGIARLEGYLLCQAENRTARAEAEAFARRLPWLTGDQHEEVVRLYTEERLALARSTLQRIADRCHELHADYAARYEDLRRRLARAMLAVLLGAASLYVCALLAIRPG
ncbi:hypothetical protein [Streptomyces sp. H27-D2]|uniref:hypothetical protein n=1 Tax=Streptomyces sp. H27-D2 TaxID=3046304 RepID=UPI002DBBF661|nr:hypothetical protein [Streptomyces sp. H27-D2]MEC4016333.1 hypothetical protein [Streptomyces sp. H27-D2]